MLVTVGDVDRRLRELGVGDEYHARTGDEPLFMHLREDGVVRNWYATTPLGVMMLKSDIKVMQHRRCGRLTIELGKGMEKRA